MSVSAWLDHSGLGARNCPPAIEGSHFQILSANLTVYNVLISQWGVIYSLLPNFVEWFLANIFVTKCPSHMGVSALAKLHHCLSTSFRVICKKAKLHHCLSTSFRVICKKPFHKIRQRTVVDWLDIEESESCKVIPSTPNTYSFRRFCGHCLTANWWFYLLVMMPLIR